MPRKILSLLSLLLAPAVACATAQTAVPTAPAAHVCYVATDGADANPGTLAQPWRTIQHAADVMVAGDTVYVRAGVYNERIRISRSGSEPAGYITFAGFPGETAIVDGTGLPAPSADAALIVIDSHGYIAIKELELRNYSASQADATPMGVYITGDAHHIQLLGNTIHHIATNGGADGNAHGIAVYGRAAPAAIHDILIQGNELRDLKLGNSEALVLNGNVTDFAIIDNAIHDCDNIGIDLIGFEGAAPDPAYDQARDGIVRGNTIYNIDTLTNPAYGGARSAGGIYVDGGARIIIERNVVHHSNIGIEIASEHAGRATSHVTVQNNLIFHNHIAGLALGGYDTLRGSTENCAIINNTLYHNDSDQDGNGELYLQYDTRNNTIANNIIVANDQGLLLSNAYTQNSGNVVDYNLYYSPLGAVDSAWRWRQVAYLGFDAYRNGSGNDTHSYFADPRFVNTTSSDFHLLGNSPAIDAGALAMAPGEDFSGRSRPVGAAPDLGAYEYGQSSLLYLPTILISALDAANLRLSWTHDTPYQSYSIWRSGEPYLTPTGSPIATRSRAPWHVDRADLGGPAANHFYLVQGRRHDGGIMLSEQVGEFDFALTPGG